MMKSQKRHFLGLFLILPILVPELVTLSSLKLVPFFVVILTTVIFRNQFIMDWHLMLRIVCHHRQIEKTDRNILIRWF